MESKVVYGVCLRAKVGSKQEFEVLDLFYDCSEQGSKAQQVQFLQRCFDDETDYEYTDGVSLTLSRCIYGQFLALVEAVGPQEQVFHS